MAAASDSTFAPVSRTTTARRGFLGGIAALPLAAMPARANVLGGNISLDVPAILAELRHLSTVVDGQREKVQATNPGMESAFAYVPDALRPLWVDIDYFAIRPGHRGWTDRLIGEIETMSGLSPDACARRDQILAGKSERWDRIEKYARESGREDAMDLEHAALDRADALIGSLLDLGPSHAAMQVEAFVAFHGEGDELVEDPLLLRFLTSFRAMA